MFRFRTDVSVFTCLFLVGLAALFLNIQMLWGDIRMAVAAMLEWAGATLTSSSGLVALAVLGTAGLVGLCAGLPQRMTRYGGAPPKGALTKVLTPVYATAALAVVAMVSLVWLQATGIVEHPIQPILVNLAQVFSGAVLLRSCFLMYRITSECRMAVLSADWP